MSQINITPEDFSDLIISFLMDNFKSTEESTTPNNERWNEFIDLLELKGIKTHTLQYYIKMDSKNRLAWKRIKKVFEGDINSARINISKNQNLEEQSDNVHVKELVKKVVKLAKNERQRTGFPVSDEKLDKIINYIVEQEEQNG